jgi:hypothetical protein
VCDARAIDLDLNSGAADCVAAKGGDLLDHGSAARMSRVTAQSVHDIRIGSQHNQISVFESGARQSEVKTWWRAGGHIEDKPRFGKRRGGEHADRGETRHERLSLPPHHSFSPAVDLRRRACDQAMTSSL